MEHKIKGNQGWQQITSSNQFIVWGGFAFECICAKHIYAIKKKLGISGVYTEQSSWRYCGNKKTKGAQIDLLIDRKDGCINLCEIKFSNSEFAITKNYAAILEYKKQAFATQAKTKKNIFVTMIKTFGIVNNDYKTQSVDAALTSDELFR